jgi:hypothetical protein
MYAYVPHSLEYHAALVICVASLVVSRQRRSRMYEPDIFSVPLKIREARVPRYALHYVGYV